MSVFDYTHRCDGVHRRGWVVRGIKDPETVGEHMRACVQIASELADALNVDRFRLTAMLAVHDLPESDPDVGDIIPSDGVSKEEKYKRERAAMQKICANLPEGDEMVRLWEEFEQGDTPEARIAKQIDVVQMIVQARRYEREQGLDIADFLHDAGNRVTHPVLVERLKNL